MAEPDFETLDVSVEDGIATIKLANDPVNAISQTVRFELDDALPLIRDEEVRIVIIAGAGDVFSVGADIALFEAAQEWTTPQFRANSRVLGRVFDGLEALEKPVLAVIDGACVGGGYELALACDVRIAGPDATIGFPERNIGLIPGLGGCSRFVDLVGPGRAKDLVFRGALLDAEEAADYGMVEHVEPDPEAFAREYAADLLEGPPQALGLSKRVITAASDTDVATAGLLESLAQSTLIETADHREGIEAFREDRPPEFSGR